MWTQRPALSVSSPNVFVNAAVVSMTCSCVPPLRFALKIVSLTFSLIPSLLVCYFIVLVFFEMCIVTVFFHGALLLFALWSFSSSVCLRYHLSFNVSRQKNYEVYWIGKSFWEWAEYHDFLEEVLWYFVGSEFTAKVIGVNEFNHWCLVMFLMMRMKHTAVFAP